MALERFKIIAPSKEGHSTGSTFETILINRDHIVSLKPIRMIVDEKLVMGYWIRTTNSKKYRAVEIPESIKAILETDVDGGSMINLNVLNEDPSQLEILH